MGPGEVTHSMIYQLPYADVAYDPFEDWMPHHNAVRNNTITLTDHTGISNLYVRDVLIEGNVVSTSGSLDGNAYQQATEQLIFRYNLGYKCGPGTSTCWVSYTKKKDLDGGPGTRYTDVKLINNRYYNNTFTKSEGTRHVGRFYWEAGGLQGTGWQDNVLANNIFYKDNASTANEFSWERINYAPDGLTVCTLLCNEPDAGDYCAETNDGPGDIWKYNLMGSGPGGTSMFRAFLRNDDCYWDTTVSFDQLTTELEPGFPDWYCDIQDNNIQGNPLFTDPDGDIYTLGALSPCRDTGGALTTVANADTGSGTSLIVEDARWFQSGTGSPWSFESEQGVLPDEIAVGTVGNTVAIVSLDYSTNTLTIASGISRQDGDNVWLYKKSDGGRVLYGTAPDMGAFESTTGTFSVSSVTPVDEASGQGLYTKVKLAFDADLNPATAIPANIYVTCNGTPQNALWLNMPDANKVNLYVIDALLPANETCTVTATDAVLSDVGDSLIAHSSTFSTEASHATPPTVTDAEPDDLATGVPVTKKPYFEFSEELDPETTTLTSNLTLNCGGAIAGYVIQSGPSRVKFYSDEDLPALTECTFTATTSIEDKFNNALAAPHVVTWTTE
jgi:hypothetical protein